ncbi:hypothetical protein JCGZ_18136 [Jatropha curcas]|uniref:Uncharacterized protein n=1 Tax=Jatropha curcas TaxID=180498 RepID=A0A067K5T8_JATCU|nr:hypothetical protein JCGZ_18136 [Jatropha curcas]
MAELRLRFPDGDWDFVHAYKDLDIKEEVAVDASVLGEDAQCPAGVAPSGLEGFPGVSNAPDPTTPTDSGVIVVELALPTNVVDDRPIE